MGICFFQSTYLFYTYYIQWAFYTPLSEYSPPSYAPHSNFMHFTIYPGLFAFHSRYHISCWLESPALCLFPISNQESPTWTANSDRLYINTLICFTSRKWCRGSPGFQAKSCHNVLMVNEIDCLVIFPQAGCITGRVHVLAPLINSAALLYEESYRRSCIEYTGLSCRIFRWISSGCLREARHRCPT